MKKTGNRIIMFLAGLLLAAAALLKFHETLTVYIPSWREEGIWESYEFFLLQIPLEFGLGIWMLSGVFRKAAWIAGTLCYFGFIFVTLGKALLGYESCGCFGQIHVNPWHTLFIVDVPIFLLLLIFRPKGEKLLPPPWPHPLHALAVAVPVIGFMAVASPILVALRPQFKKPENWTAVKPVRPIETQPADPHPINPVQTRPDPSETTEPAKPAETKPVETTEPEEPDEVQPDPSDEPEEIPLWPWLEHIDIAEQLKSGIAVILMYHHDCPICAEIVPRYSEYCRQLQQRGEEAFRIAFVAIPPYREEGPVPADTTCLHGKLSDQEKWAIMSPYVVALIDGAFVRDWPQGTAPPPEKLLDEIFATE